MKWIPIQDFAGYSVNSLGEVRNDLSGRVLASNVNQYDVVYVGLMRDNRQRQRSVALLVASAFVPRQLPAFDTPINMNGDRFDNRVENLTWRPRWFAVAYNRQFKNGYQNPIEKPMKDLKTGELYRNSFDCATRHGLLERDVVLSLLNRTFVWPTYQQFGMA